MNMLRLDYYFHTPHLFADRSVLGKSFVSTFEERPITIRMPRDWPLRRGEDAFDIRGDYLYDHGFEDDDPPGTPDGTVEIGITTVSFEVNDVSELLSLPAGDTFFSAHSELVASHIELAREAARNFVLWVSIISDQAQMAMDERGPYLLAGVAVDLDKGRRLQGGYSETGLALMGRAGPRGVLTLTGFDRVADSVGSHPPSAEKLLRTAEFEVTHQGPGRPGSGVLLAAIACEVKVKLALTSAAPEGWTDMVDEVVRRPRKGVASLYGDLMKPVFGVSMKDRDPELFARLKSLVEARNASAHGNVSMEIDEAQKHLATARDVFAWINDVMTRNLE